MLFNEIDHFFALDRQQVPLDAVSVSRGEWRRHETLGGETRDEDADLLKSNADPRGRSPNCLGSTGWGRYQEIDNEPRKKHQ